LQNLKNFDFNYTFIKVDSLFAPLDSKLVVMFLPGGNSDNFKLSIEGLGAFNIKIIFDLLHVL